MSPEARKMMALMLGGGSSADTSLNLLMAEMEKANQSEVEYSTKKKILIPEGMSLLDASNELKRQHLDLEQEVEVVRDFSKWMPDDVLVATRKAAERQFGYIAGKTKFTFWGNHPPAEVEIRIGIVNGKEVTTRCFYGSMTVAAWEDADLSVSTKVIRSTVKKRYRSQVVDFLDTVEEILLKESIYRGQAVSVTQIDGRNGKELKFEIFELSPKDDIVLNEGTRSAIDYFFIPYLDDPNKRTALFSGPFGNGKTETALAIGRTAMDLGLVFFYCKTAKGFESLLETAVQYQPVLIFMEDLDAIASGEERTDRLNEVLNTVDGATTKGKSVKVIFTTNNEANLNAAMVRPGRLDLILSFDNPNPETTAKILRNYWEGYAEDDLDYLKVAEELGSVNGSTIAEVGKRGLQLAVRKNELISSKMALAAIESMRYQIQVMHAANNKGKSVLPDITFKIRGGEPTMSVTNHVGELSHTV